MADTYWYVDAKGDRRGPIGRDEVARLIADGVIGRDTLVWSGGMSDWRAAGQVTGLSDLFGALPPAAAGVIPLAGANGALRPEIPVWGLFWRLIVGSAASLFVIPIPWIVAWLVGWVVERIRLPDGVRLKFIGRGGQIWLGFLGFVVAAVLADILIHVAFAGSNQTSSLIAGLLAVLVIIIFEYLFYCWLFKWICANVTSEDGRLKLSFEGDYLRFVGWGLLTVVSAYTIIGWAWVLKYMLRWMCKNVRGSQSFEFRGSGLGILWRSLVGALLSVLVIPIPWVLRWLYTWYISQVSVV